MSSTKSKASTPKPAKPAPAAEPGGYGFYLYLRIRHTDGSGPDVLQLRSLEPATTLGQAVAVADKALGPPYSDPLELVEALVMECHRVLDVSKLNERAIKAAEEARAKAAAERAEFERLKKIYEPAASASSSASPSEVQPPTARNVEIVVQPWVWRDRWSGPSANGFTLHATEDARVDHVKYVIDQLPDAVQDEYPSPELSPIKMEVSAAFAKYVANTATPSKPIKYQNLTQINEASDVHALSAKSSARKPARDTTPDGVEIVVQPWEWMDGTRQLVLHASEESRLAYLRHVAPYAVPSAETSSDFDPFKVKVSVAFAKLVAEKEADRKPVRVRSIEQLEKVSEQYTAVALP